MKRTILTLTTLMLTGTAHAGSVDTAAEVVWSSSPGQTEILANEISELYQTLYNSQNLRIQQVKNNDGLDPQSLMRKSKVFYGSGFPWVMENILCDLNRGNCKRPLEPVSASDLADITKHVGGFAVTDPKQSRWTLGKYDTVTLPDYAFDATTSLGRVAVSKGWTPARAKISPLADCSRWKASCADVVKKYNPSRVPLKYDGFAILPVVSFETVLPLKDDTDQTVADKTVSGNIFKSIREKMADKGTLTANTYAIEEKGDFATGLTTHWQSTSQNDAVLKSLRGNLSAIGSIKGHSIITDEPAYANQKQLFDVINHPYGDGVALRPEYKHAVNVMVIDSKLVAEHCDLPKVIFPNPAAEDIVCEEQLGEFNTKRDHAAHVIGMIAAPVNGQGMIGLNPSARVHFREVPFVILGNDEDDIYLQAFFEALELDVRVVNASMGMTPDAGRPNFLKLGIQSLAKNALIVVSAGNDARELLEDDCDVYPACYFREPNVITVVGLSQSDAQVDLWMEADAKGSNFSPHFHIAGLAKDVLSTVEGNKLAYVSGTSIAAPQVSAAASLIYSATEAAYPDKLNELGVLPPIAVKNRLLYTADIHRHLKRKVFSGLLNVERAIEIKYAQLEYRDADTVLSVKGHVIEVGTDTLICRTDDGGTEEHAWRDIRRIYFDPGSDRIILFKLKQPDNPESEIDEAICPRLLTQSNQIKMELEGGETVSLKLDDIRDFTSALFPLPPEFPE